MAYIPSFKKNSLKPGDGMSASGSTSQQRAEVIAKLQDLEAPDCIEFGFYMGTHMPGPIPDYDGKGVLRQITLKDVS